MQGISLFALIWSGSLILALIGVQVSANVSTWLACCLALPVAVWLAGSAGRKPIVVAHFGLLWGAIFGGLLVHDIQGQAPETYVNEQSAILLSLVGLLSIALGYRAGFSLFRDKPAVEGSLSRSKLLLSYLVLFAASSVFQFLAVLFPELTQPIIALNGLRFLMLYLLSSQVVQDRSGYPMLLGVLILEIIMGSIGYIASYQVPVLVVLAATLNARKQSLGVAQILVSGLVFALLLSASVVWTAVKPEYRAWLAAAPASETESVTNRVTWLSDQLGAGFDLQKAAVRFVERIGYTELYGAARPRLDQMHTTYYLDAILNVLTPRVLFPDKAALDDTRITSELTGRTFGQGTSVSIGFIAQAEADFGVPFMFVALIVVGLSLGSIGRFFLTRECTQAGRDGLMTAALVFRFVYEQNIDKAVGGLVIMTLALVVFLRVLYHPFETLGADEARNSFASAHDASKVSA